MDDVDESVSSLSGSTTLSIDVPFEAHLLPGRGRRLCAVLPIICVANPDTIVSLITSILYQRFVWGIDQPVVGLSFSETGTVGRVFLGWLDSGYIDRQQMVCPLCSVVLSIASSMLILGIAHCSYRLSI